MFDTKVIEELKGVLGPSNLVLEPDEVERYSTDALTPARAFGAAPLLERTADAVAMPSSTEEVAAIVKLAAAHGMPVVPYGGGTGVMGAVVPVNGGIVVDLHGLNRVLEVNARDRTATVEAGVVLEDLAKALDEKGLMLGHDPWSVPIATVGGAIATNGVGYRAAAVGPMGAQVLSLEVVLPSGQILTTRSVPRYSSGPNLNQLFIGSEGSFGIITKATLQVLRQPEQRDFSTFRFPTFDRGFWAVVELFALGLRPSVVDLTEDSDGVHLYMVFEGYKEGVAAQHWRTAEVCKTFDGKDMGPREATVYWDTRYSIAERYRDNVARLSRRERWQQRSWSFDYLHVALPISRVLEYRRRSDEVFREYDICVSEHAIWTGPELYSMLLVPGDRTRQEDMVKAVDRALILAQDMGGVMEYCHGVGIKLAHLLAREMGVGLEVVRAMKRALDPYNIMNPGKLGL